MFFFRYIFTSGSVGFRRLLNQYTHHRHNHRRPFATVYNELTSRSDCQKRFCSCVVFYFLIIGNNY